MNLYEVNEAVETAFNLAIDPETGEVNEQQLMLLEMLEMERDKKVENIALLIKNYRADAAALKAEKDALQKRQKAAEAKAESLTRYLASYLAGAKFNSPKASVTWRKTTRVEMDPGVNILSIPNDYLRFKDPELDKAKAAAALKAGETIEGLHLEESQSMTIK